MKKFIKQLQRELERATDKRDIDELNRLIELSI